QSEYRQRTKQPNAGLRAASIQRLFAPLQDPTRREVCPSWSAPSPALLCGGLTMLTTAVNFPTRRAPSPQIRAKDTPLYSTTNGSAGVNSASDVDAGINAAPHLGGQCCRDHDDRGESTNYRKLAEHNLSLPCVQITPMSSVSTGEGERG